MMHHGFGVDELQREAQRRWLKPSEVLFILQNHERHPLTPEPPQKPPSGSMFLFNRRVLRFFRKDGHMWRKKKDGRTVGEAHERLKVGNADTLNCYYAHGEQNPYFQRRSYWMLDPAYEHIVLVHYREVAEGRYVSRSISNLSTESLSTSNLRTCTRKAHVQHFIPGISELHGANYSTSNPVSLEEVSSKFSMGKIEKDHLKTMESSGSYNPSPQQGVNQALRKLALQLSLDDDDSENSIYFEDKLAHCQHEESQDLGTLDSEVRSSLESNESVLHGLKYNMHGLDEETGERDCYNSMQCTKIPSDNWEPPITSPASGSNIEREQSISWTDMLELTSSSPVINSHGRTSTLLSSECVHEPPSHGTSEPERNYCSMNMLKDDTILPSAEREKISEKFTWQELGHGLNIAENRTDEDQLSESDLSLQLSASRKFCSCTDKLKDSGISSLEANSNILLRKENSTDLIGDVDLANMYSLDLSGMWFDNNGYSLTTDSSLTVAQKQRFSIREVSPEWAYSSSSTKVIITGTFLCDPSEFPLAAMFGDIEVPIEIVQDGVLRCHAPPHCAGKVTLCITSGNREACSEIREFEFHSMLNTSSLLGTSPQAKETKNNEELLPLVRFVQILCGCDGSTISKGGIEPDIGYFKKLQTDNCWQQIIEALLLGCETPSDILHWILQELLKDKLQQWLISKYHGKDCTDCLLSKQEQGIIHMISSLGYEWALNPILESGVGINFRDKNGWTALHWAAQFGREKMVAALLAAGASAGAVTDPTPQDPVGKTPGDISAASGHKGLAGYLSEVALTNHLSVLTMEECEISKGSAVVDAERAVESISERTVHIHVGGTEDELSLKDSLAAVRNAAQAAARIQAAFRVHSFRNRQENASRSQDEYGITAEDIHGLSAASKFQRALHGHRDQKFDGAALSIQKKYRGWKGRKEFITLRRHVVNIQAHVRGYQVRNKYKEFLWTVGVVEKVILRWRRRGVGLRGFRAEPEMNDEAENDDIVKVFRKEKVDAALDKAMSRVLSMVDSPDARQQYRRMLESYRQAKTELSNGDEGTSRLVDDFDCTGNDEFMNFGWNDQSSAGLYRN